MKKLLAVAAVAAASFGFMGVTSSVQASCGAEGDTIVAELPDTGTGVSGAVKAGGTSPAGHYVAADTGQGVSYCSDGTFDAINDILGDLP